MLHFTDQLRRLKVDYYEYVSMKVIVLLTSGLNPSFLPFPACSMCTSPSVSGVFFIYINACHLYFISDASGLKEPEHVRNSQEKVVRELQHYTTSNYPSMPSKFSDLLLRMPELHRVCQVIYNELIDPFFKLRTPKNEPEVPNIYRSPMHTGFFCKKFEPPKAAVVQKKT